MKTQILKPFLLVFFMTFSIITFAQENKTVKIDLNGTSWAYSVPDAPYGYQDGSIAFKNADDKLTAVATIRGTSYTIKEIIKKDDQYACSLYVDGSDVKITFKPGTDKITGIVVAEGWEMPVTLIPQEK